MDRRAFLAPLGLGCGVGLAASQLTLVKKAQAAEVPGGCWQRQDRSQTHHVHPLLGGCAVDAIVENGVWVRQEPVFDSPINLGSTAPRGLPCASMATASSACVTP
jgi:formate dehydrogenase major subunit